MTSGQRVVTNRGCTKCFTGPTAIPPGPNHELQSEKTKPVIEIERHAWFHAGCVADSSPAIPNRDPRGPCRFQIRSSAPSRR
ncbi:hypothetical protein AGR7A_Lc10059 [Agrobacterium deltaense NCPPB 1641]|uniref:Uncharacterized protein n=1 Tax=Agrobacterium deltaense NCPPB 1641 TaxID=1183425 RepID=A0A1S7TRX1_9HYPH|nr:hypothetical protein AGR7A_Lc10059 [Agrobacterium deltaense NCPPB 1641]